jgi:hypothetical protein
VTLLAEAEIKSMSEAGTLIAASTFQPKSLKPASYDITIAADA